jgi:hypothetical protein
MLETARQIHAQTGWSYAEARRRLFYVNLDPSATPAHLYRDMETRPADATAARPSGLRRIDGYFVGRDQRVPARPGSSDWPLGEEIEETVRAGIDSGAIRLGLPASHDDLLLVPFEVAAGRNLPAALHDLSEAYSFDAVPSMPASPGMKRAVLTFNDNPWRDPVYDIRADVGLRPTSAGRWSFRVVLSGEPLSQNEAWISPDWAQMLVRPFLLFRCGAEERRVTLAGQIGASPLRLLGKAFVAPYELDFEASCPRDIRSISIGYESGVAYSVAYPGDLTDGRLLPGGVRAAAGL